MLNKLKKMNKVRIKKKKKDTDNVKQNQRNFEAEEYNNWNRKFTRGVQYQKRSIKIKNQWTQTQVIWTYTVRQYKQKRMKISKEILWDL